MIRLTLSLPMNPQDLAVDIRKSIFLYIENMRKSRSSGFGALGILK